MGKNNTLEVGGTIYISVISHEQSEEVMKNFSGWEEFSEKYSINLIITDNSCCDDLEDFCASKGFSYIRNLRVKGFGENHNNAFQFASMKTGDVFIICNPDVYVEERQLMNIINYFRNTTYDFMNARCFYDLDKKTMSNPDRSTPCLFNFVVSILTGVRLHYGSDESIAEPEWISGEFMCIRPGAYRALKGFDPGYHMYVEDVDICLRARKKGFRIGHNSSNHIVHLTKMKSRKVFNKNVIWHFRSAIRFVIKNRILCVLRISK